MKKIILVIILAVYGWNVMAQDQKCGTMERLEQLKAKDPTLQARMDSLEIATQEWIKKNRAYPVYNNVEYPIIPGFVPTGDPKIDAANFAKAKKELYGKDPELYRKLTRQGNQKADKELEKKRKMKEQNKLRKN